ncbi:MAG: peptidase [Calditrichia bacterium]
MTGRKLRLPVIFLALSIWSMALFAKKPEQHQQLEKLENEIEETIRYADMRVSKITGAPVALYRVNYPVKAASPEVMARQYLQENAVLLHINENLGNLSHTRTIETPGGLHVRFRQLVGGFPVYNSDIVVTLNRSETVTFVMSDYKPLAKLDNTVPAISIGEATRSAKAYLNIQGQIQFEKAETVVYHNAGKTRLAHKIVIVPAEDLFGDWELLVDAHSGDIFRVEDKAVYGGPTENVTGSGWVFDPDPLTHARVNYSGQFVDNNDANSDSLTAHTVQRDLLDIEFDGTNYHLRGPYAQIVDSESPFNGLFSQATNQWHNLRNASAFEAANVYYHLDASMRYINEELGFNLMPYQYSGGVKGDPHGLSGSDNSHYISSTGQLAWGEGGVDDSEDADVILHELGHGLHDWLTNGGLSQVNGLSEGCGDYWANSHNRSKTLDSGGPQWWVFQWMGTTRFGVEGSRIIPQLIPAGLVPCIRTVKCGHLR